MLSDVNKYQHKKVTRLENKQCAYCNKDFSSDRTIEHVVGRNFVPKGSLNVQWNLLLRVCKECNFVKSGLEDDISAITLLTAMSENPARTELYNEKINNKAGKSKSKRTLKFVKDSCESSVLQFSYGTALRMKFNIQCPPQIDFERIYKLAHYHIKAFFYLLTYNSELQLGYQWKGIFGPLDACPECDWGNVLHASFAQKVRSWHFRAHFSTANGYFRCMIRKHPTFNCWSWALEWNKSYRVIGLIGEEAPIKEFCKELTARPKTLILADGIVEQYISQDVPLQEKDDILFDFNDEELQ